MPRILVIGAGITGVTTAYALNRLGHEVTVVDLHRYPAMETSYANGGQLSASNAEVWNHPATLAKGLKWMLQPAAPLLLNPRPSWHKYSWLAEFVAAVPGYEANTVATTRMAIAAREHLFSMAREEGIAFDLQQRGILHVYQDLAGLRAAERANRLMQQGGLERRLVTPQEIRAIEPALQGRYAGGYYTPSDSTGDIHKFTRGLADAAIRRGVRLRFDTAVRAIRRQGTGLSVSLAPVGPDGQAGEAAEHLADGVVVCAGVASRGIARLAGDRVNVYPVKGYSITVHLDESAGAADAPWVSLLDERAKIVTSRLGQARFRVAGTAEFNGMNRDIRADRIAPLVQWVRENFAMDTSRVVPWAGLRPMMPDMMPRVRRGAMPGVYYNTGHGHLGWTLSAATAVGVAALIQEDMPAAC